MSDSTLSAQAKIAVAVSICGVERVHDALSDFLDHLSGLSGTAMDANSFEVGVDGSIYRDDLGKPMTGNELSIFAEWCERENKGVG